MTTTPTCESATPTIAPTFVPVEDTWIDYNGHLSEGYFVLAFSRAIDDTLDHVGLGEPYRTATDCAVFTVEAHVRYLNQVRAGTTVEIRNRITAIDSKRLRTVHEMYAGDTLCATEEVTGLHVDRAANKAAAFSPALQTSIASYLRQDLDAPSVSEPTS